MRQAVSSDRAPKAIGPYSQAITAGQLVFCAGQIAIDARAGELVSADVGEQTRQVLRNLGAVLEAAGASYADVVRTTVYLADLADFGAMNAAYAEFFAPPAPARTTVQAARLPRDARVEIDAIALLSR